MKLPKIAIDNYQFVIIVILLALMGGTLSFLNMPRSEDPVVEFPFYPLVAIYPGTSPEDIEELVLKPIEAELKEIDEIKEIRSGAVESLGFISIECEFGVDTDDKYDELTTIVNKIRPELPEDLYDLDLRQVSPFDVIIAQYALTSENAPYSELKEYAEGFQDILKRVDGVGEVNIEALPAREIRISLDFQEMANRNIPLKQVMGIIQGNNASIPGGDLKIGNKTFSIKTSGSYNNIESIRNTVVSAGGGNVVYLRDIATVDFDYEDQRYLGRYNDEPAVFLSVTQKEGKNIINISDEIRAAYETYKKILPTNVDLHYAFEQGPAVKARINDFFKNLLQGVLLVGAIVLLFLGFRSAVVVMLVIPTSIMIAIGVLDLYGYGLQQMTIAGLVIALGLLVDNGIVVIENIDRFIKEGFSLKEAAIKGTSEVGYAIVSSTVTTILSFFPLMFLGGPTGEFIKSMPMIVVFSLIASLLLALTLSPLLASKFLSVKKQFTVFGKVMQFIIEKGYRKLLNFSLRFPLIILFVALGLFAGSVALFPIVGVSFFPNADKPLVLVDIETPDGSNIDRTNEAVKYVESVLSQSDYVMDYSANIGKGNPQVYYNRNTKNLNQTYGQVMANLKYWDPIRFYGFIDSLRAEFDTYTGARIVLSELKNGPPAEAPIAIRILGKNLDTLKNIAANLTEIIENEKGTLNVFNPLSSSKTDIQVNINRDKAGMIGLSLADIDLAIRASLTGVTVTEVYLDDGEEYPIVVRLPYDDKLTIDDFDKIYLTTAIGAQVPLRQVASLEFVAGPTKIDHYDTERSVTVTADVGLDYNVTNLTESIIEKLDAYKLPIGYEFVVSGEYADQQESFGNLGNILLAALVGIFAVLVLQFRSLVQPFVVFSAIPLAFTGSIVALYLVGYSFSFLAFVGFTSLMGIVINNSIILVDYTNQLLARGVQKVEAIQQAAETRFTPIILTTLTTIFGLLPLTLTNSDLWTPLGWTIIGGMISSTLLTLLMVPILLKWLTRVSESAS